MNDPDPKRTAKPDVVCSGCLARNRQCSCKLQFQIFGWCYFLACTLVVVSLLAYCVASVVRSYLVLN